MNEPAGCSGAARATGTRASPMSERGEASPRRRSCTDTSAAISCPASGAPAPASAPAAPAENAGLISDRTIVSCHVGSEEPRRTLSPRARLSARTRCAPLQGTRGTAEGTGGAP